MGSKLFKKHQSLYAYRQKRIAIFFKKPLALKPMAYLSISFIAKTL
jgi:hypothetical protein